jgi:predicted DNA-binding ribbon-helix-helix protein
MAALTVRLPNSVHQKIKELAEREDISVNQFIASAAAEKMASFMALEYLRLEASKGNRNDFMHYLSMMPDAPACDVRVELDS